MECGSYRLIKKSSQCKARLGRVFTARGIIDTPAFMPVGTNATVKGIAAQYLRDCGAQIILANYYEIGRASCRERV